MRPALTRIQTRLSAAIPERGSCPPVGGGSPQDSGWRATNPGAQQHRCPGPGGSQNTGRCRQKSRRCSRNRMEAITAKWEEGVRTQEGQAVSQTPLEPESPQQGASSAGPGTAREADGGSPGRPQLSPSARPSPQVTPTMLRWRGLLKSTCASSSSSLRRTSCGLNSRPWTGRTEPHSHKKSKTARKSSSCCARCSSKSRLLEPAGRKGEGSTTSL